MGSLPLNTGTAGGSGNSGGSSSCFYKVNVMHDCINMNIGPRGPEFIWHFGK